MLKTVKDIVQDFLKPPTQGEEVAVVGDGLEVTMPDEIAEFCNTSLPPPM